MRTRIWTVGIFVVAGIALFAIVLFLIGNAHEMFGNHYKLYTEFSNVDGISPGIQIHVSGFAAGKLSNIQIPKSPSSRFRLTLEMDQNVKALVRKDSVATIATAGVMGGKFIDVKIGSPNQPEAAPGSTLRSTEPVDIGSLIAKAGGMMNQVQGTIKDVHGKVDTALDSVTKTVNHTDNLITGVTGNVEKIASNGTRITGTVDQIVNGIQQGQGPAGVLLKDKNTANRIKATVGNVEEATTNLKDASAKVDGMIGEAQSRGVVQKADATIGNVKDLTQHLNTTIAQAMAPDRIGQTGGQNIRTTLSNMAQTSTNIAADTEAIKHEFFFRGFFNRRGYFNLQHISADKYRTDKQLAKHVESRRWLTASELFEMGSNGKERISKGGRDVLNQVVGTFVGSLPDHPIVIEGYSSKQAIDKQYLQGRERALLVRDYLEHYFHISQSHLGIVSLNSTPPENVGRSSWDGICLAILE